jgi:hypothetical protein
MQLESIVRAHLETLELFSDSPGEGAEAVVETFSAAWRELGRALLAQQLQQQIDRIESDYRGSQQKRSRRYQTPLGTIELSRRAYGGPVGGCLVDTLFGLPSDGWFRQVQELSCALGVGSEFGNANRLLHRWSGVSLSEKTLANHVEKYGSALVEAEAAAPEQAACPVRSGVSVATRPAPERPIFYIGADGIHTPMHQGGTCEAKVGVMFWDADHLRLSQSRAMVKQREYVATLDGVDGFRDQLNRCDVNTVQQQPHQVVFLGDGAPWLWLMAALLFPDAIHTSSLIV